MHSPGGATTILSGSAASKQNLDGSISAVEIMMAILKAAWREEQRTFCPLVLTSSSLTVLTGLFLRWCVCTKMLLTAASVVSCCGVHHWNISIGWVMRRDTSGFCREVDTVIFASGHTSPGVSRLLWFRRCPRGLDYAPNLWTTPFSLSIFILRLGLGRELSIFN